MMEHQQMLELKRWNTPTVYNGWEQITSHDIAADGFNVEETRDFMPQMGPMVGRAVTVVIGPSNPEHRTHAPAGGQKYRQYVASVAGPSATPLTGGGGPDATQIYPLFVSTSPPV